MLNQALNMAIGDNRFNKELTADHSHSLSLFLFYTNMGFNLWGLVRNGVGTSSRRLYTLHYCCGKQCFFAVLRNDGEDEEEEEFRCVWKRLLRLPERREEDAFSQIREAINGVFFAR